MHLVHKTRDGNLCFISQMSDNHLQRTIYLLLDNLLTNLNISASETTITPKQRAIYGLKLEEIQEDATGFVPKQLNHLYPYIAEATLRQCGWFLEMVEKLRYVMGRDAQDSHTPPAGLLESRVEDYDDTPF